MYREVKKPEFLGIAAEWNRAELDRAFDTVYRERESPVDELDLALDWNKLTPILQGESV